jgi:hypothetical protein
MTQVAKEMFWVRQLAPSANPKNMGKGNVICARNHKTKYKKLKETRTHKRKDTPNKKYSTIVYITQMPNFLCIVLLEVNDPISALIEIYSIVFN